MQHSYLVNPIALKACLHLAADQKSGRFVIAGVCCYFFPNGVRYVATDGRTLGVVTDAAAPIPAAEAPEATLNLDFPTVKRVLDIAKATKHTAIGVTWDEPAEGAATIPIAIGGDAVPFPCAFSKYPTWQQAVPRRSWVARADALVSLDSAYATQAGAFFRQLTDPKLRRNLAECIFVQVSPNASTESRVWLATTAKRLVGRLTAYAVLTGVKLVDGQTAATLADASLPFPE